MKSLIFCTSYVKDLGEWKNRYQKWIDYYIDLPFSKDKALFLIDDGSDEENLSEFNGNRYNEGGEINPLPPVLPPQVNLYHFKKRKGIFPEDNAPGLYGSTLGWYRSFLFSSIIAKKNDYDKIIHIESDAYLLTQKVCDYIDSLDSGWNTLYCPMYHFPETSIQIICKDQFPSMLKLEAMPLDSFRLSQAEETLPITHVEKGFVGDRYGERTTMQLPKIDYYNQCNLITKLKFRN